MTDQTVPALRYSATIHMPEHRFPLEGAVTREAMLMLANNGNTSQTITPELEAEAQRIEDNIRAGRIATTRTATIRPTS